MAWYVARNLYINTNIFWVYFIFLYKKIMWYDWNGMIDWINWFLSIEFLNNEIHKIILAFIVFFVVYFGLKFIMKYIHRKIKFYTKDKHESIWVLLLNLVKDFPKWFFFVLEIYIPIKILTLSSEVDMVVNAIFLFAVTLQLIRLVVKITIFALSDMFKGKNKKEDKTAKKTIQMMVSIVIWTIWILIFLTNIWVDLTPVIASLWIASIGIAFALQSILTDLFASFSIMLSKPFNVWDYIAVWEGSKEKTGTVVNITLKATHLLSTYGQEVVIPNSNILTTEVMNYGRMNHRRKRFKIWVVYGTSTEKLKKIPDMLKNIIDKQEFATYEWAYMSDLGAYSIDFFISYDIEQPDYVLSLSIQEKIIVGILESFEKEWIMFAYPTQTIHTPDIVNMKK